MNHKSAAGDDIFVMAVLIIMAIWKMHVNFQQADWWGVFGWVVGFILFCLYMALRIHHLRMPEGEPLEDEL